MAGWELFDPGESDGEGMEYWEWVKKLGDALFGGEGGKSEL